jgi:hypothetical protein
MRSFDVIRSAALLVVPASAIALAGSFAFARETPVETNYPGPVAHWLQQAQQDCPAGFQAHDPIQTLNLTGDGRPGFIADPHRLTCAGEPHLFIGDGPASIELFVTLPSGEVVHTGGVRALNYQVMQSPQGGAPTLTFETHDPSERAGSVDSYRWDGRNFALLNRNSMAYPPINGPDREYQ